MRIGVDIGGTNIVAGLVDDDFNIISKKSIPSKSSRNPDEIIFDIFHVSKAVLEENKLTFDPTGILAGLSITNVCFPL